MKLSKGSIFEFILGIFFISCGFNTEGIGKYIFFIGGSIGCVHCIYLWATAGKK